MSKVKVLLSCNYDAMNFKRNVNEFKLITAFKICPLLSYRQIIPNNLTCICCGKLKMNTMNYPSTSSATLHFRSLVTSSFLISNSFLIANMHQFARFKGKIFTNNEWKLMYLNICIIHFCRGNSFCFYFLFSLVQPIRIYFDIVCWFVCSFLNNNINTTYKIENKKYHFPSSFFYCFIAMHFHC